MKYRMYVDEVGSPDVGSSRDPRHRYPSLTGVVLDLAHVDAVVFPELERLKRTYFGGHPDEPIILHRKELVNAAPPFERLVAQGTEYVSAEQLSACLTSVQLKVKPKANNIAGLQLADLLAHPSFRATLCRHHQEALPATFGGKIAELLEKSNKY